MAWRCLAFFVPRLCALLACPDVCRLSYLSLLLRAAPLCATGLSCCIPPLSSAWPLAIHIFSFRSALSAAIGQSCCGVPLMLSAGRLAVSFIYLSLLCRAAPPCAIGQSCCVPAFSSLRALAHTYILLLWAAPLCAERPILLRSSFLLGVAVSAVTYSYLVLLLQGLALCAFGLSCRV